MSESNKLSEEAQELIFRIFTICSRRIKNSPLTCFILSICKDKVVFYVRSNQSLKFKKLRKTIKTNCSSEFIAFCNKHHFPEPDEYELSLINDFPVDSSQFIVDLANYKTLDI